MTSMLNHYPTGAGATHLPRGDEMMNSVQRLATIFTLAVLILGPAYMALAEDSETTQETTLTGQLSKTDKGGYVLLERVA